MSDSTRVSMVGALFHQNALCLYLEQDRDDFWVNLGEFAGWGRFRNRDRVYWPREEQRISLSGVSREEIEAMKADQRDNPPVKEHLFLLVEVIPAGSPLPFPRVCGSNSLWRKREALELLARQNAYQRGEDDSL